jgi:hypothetical protein
MMTLISLTFITILLALWISELIARRQADARAALLRAHLDDAISTELDQYEENQRLSAALADALNDRNAANLRAARAASSLRAMPAMQLRSRNGQGQPLLVRLSPYSLN